MRYQFPEWWPNPPSENKILPGSHSFDSAWASFAGEEEPKKSVRFGVYYNPEYVSFEVFGG